MLSLSGVNPTATWFTDRPARRAGTAPVGATLKAIDFAKPAPNAVIEVPGAPATENAMAVTLRDPVYDEAAGTLQFAAERLKNVGRELKTYRPALDPQVAPTFGAVGLFIDDGDTPVVTDNPGNPDLVGQPNGSPSCNLTITAIPDNPRLGLMVLAASFHAGEYHPWQGDDFAAFKNGYVLPGGKSLTFTAPFTGTSDPCGGSAEGILTLDGTPHYEYRWHFGLENPNYGDTTISCYFDPRQAAPDGSDPDLLGPNDHPACNASVNARGQPANATIQIGIASD